MAQRKIHKSVVAMPQAFSVGFLLCESLCVALCVALEALAKDEDAGDDPFTGAVPSLRIEIPAEGMKVLRQYHQVWRQPRPERIDVRATVRVAGRVYTN